MVQPRPPMTSSNISNVETFHALAHLSEYTHTLDSLPLDLSRNFADLRELDAVLSSSMSTIIGKITSLTDMIENGRASKEERLWLLTEIAEEASRLKLGGEDKIRVACQAADNLKSNMVHLKMLAASVPGFDAAIVNRKTVYPHVAARSFMPAMSLETGRRKRGGYSSLLVSAPDPSPAKKRRAPRDEDVDTAYMRSPKKSDRTTVTENNSRPRARARKPDRAASPSESVVSVTSHHVAQAPQHMSRAQNNSNSRTNGIASNANNKRPRPLANSNNRVPTLQPNDHYALHDPTHLPPPGYNSVGANSRGDPYGVLPSSVHPSLPISYPSAGSSNMGNGTHVVPVPYDMHALPPSLVNPPDWNPPPTQLEGPGMPLSRSQPIQPMLPMISAPVSAPGGEMMEPGEGEGDADDNKTYCFCERVSYGEMIACDDNQCEREWFHLACIGLTVPPQGRWFCEACVAKRSAKRTNRGGKRRTGGSRAAGR